MSILTDKIHRERYIDKKLYGYPNQQNTGHECHCIGAAMNQMPDLPNWNEMFEPLCYLGGQSVYIHK